MPQAMFALFLAAVIGDTKPPQDASEWLARAARHSLPAIPPSGKRPSKSSKHRRSGIRAGPSHSTGGRRRYKFSVKGEGRVHWAEKWEGKGKVLTSEAWYEGNILYVRYTKDPKNLVPIEVGEGEGYFVERASSRAASLAGVSLTVSTPRTRGAATSLR